MPISFSCIILHRQRECSSNKILLLMLDDMNIETDDIKPPKNNKPQKNVPSARNGNLLPEVANPYISAATSDNTRTAYKSDIKHFIHWGGSLPAQEPDIINYLTAHAKLLNPHTLSRRLTALRNWHEYQGFHDPTSTPTVRKTLTGIHNTHGKPKQKAPPLSMGNVKQIVASTTTSTIDSRNRAMILIGFFGAFRRSELVNIKWDNITWLEEGIDILIPRSKTDQGGHGQLTSIPKLNSILCPVTALKNWQQCSRYTNSSVFVGFTKSGNQVNKTIKPNQVNIIIKQMAEKANIDNATDFSSHSLRRGFATAASNAGANIAGIMKQGRWRSQRTVVEYLDAGNRFERNPAHTICNAD